MIQITKHFAFFALCCLCTTTALAQDVWSLERCIQYAQDNNITIKQAQAAVRTAQLAESQAKAARLPNISASASAGEQFGRTIDPTTNQFITTGVGYNSMSLQAGVSLFNGGQITHSIRQAREDAKAGEADAEYATNSLALQVAQAYLSILLAEEQVVSATRRNEQSRRQLESTLKLIEAGSLPLADRFNIDAQIARDEQALVVAQNSVELGYLSLKQLLQLEPDYQMQVEKPVVQIPSEANPMAYTLPTLYNIALETQPNVRAAGFRIRSAEEAVKLAQGAYYPSLSLFGNLSTNYSTQYKKPVYTGNEVLGQSIKVDINGVPTTFALYEQEYNLERVKYASQLNENFGQGVGVSLSIPIYSNGRNRLSVERARLGVLNAELQDNQTRQQLKNDIQTAIANARAGKLQLEAAQRSYQATQIAYQNTEKRRQLGAVNTLELTLAKTNLDIAENDLLTAKYDYLFRLKILDFYEGKPLTLR